MLPSELESLLLQGAGHSGVDVRASLLLVLWIPWELYSFFSEQHTAASGHVLCTVGFSVVVFERPRFQPRFAVARR